jgi:DNA-binding protein HU-beta
MTKAELISAIAEKTELTKKDSAKALDALTETITTALSNGDKVQLVGFGTFEARERAERTGINPQTKKKIKIKATKVPAFKAGQGLKDAVSK